MKDRREEELSEADILKELKQYADFDRAYQEGKRGVALPKLPPEEASAALWPVGTCLLHPLLAVLSAVARALRAHWMTAFLARVRIASDRLSYEPRSCGLNKAYTNLGLALLRKNQVLEQFVVSSLHGTSIHAPITPPFA